MLQFFFLYHFYCFSQCVPAVVNYNILKDTFLIDNAAWPYIRTGRYLKCKFGIRQCILH